MIIVQGPSGGTVSQRCQEPFPPPAFGAMLDFGFSWPKKVPDSAPCQGAVLQWVQLPPGNCCSSQ
jgi:hypothetical protein